MHARHTRSLAQKGFSLLPSSFLLPPSLSSSSRHLSSSSRHLSSSSPLSGGKLAGKVAMVTASTDGIGLAIAQNLGRHGASVMVSSRKEDNVEKAVQQLQAEGLDVEGMVCHVGKSSDRAAILESTVKRWGGLDILVSNAAVNPYLGPIANCPEKTWDKIFDINLKSSFLMFQACQPHFQARGGGSAVFVASFLGFQQYPLLGPYSVSKTALIGLTKVLATEVWQRRGDGGRCQLPLI